MSEFVDVNIQRKSEVWKYFLLNKAKEEAKCQICEAVLKCSGHSTRSLITYLNSIHKITIKSCLDT